MNFIDYKDDRPIYEQIVDRYKMLILKGILGPEEKMPSVRKLAVELSANPNTVQRAYTELERLGFIYTVKGKGNFVRETSNQMEVKRKELEDKLREIVKEARELGIDPKELLEEAMI